MYLEQHVDQQEYKKEPKTYFSQTLYSVHLLSPSRPILIMASNSSITNQGRQ